MENGGNKVKLYRWVSIAALLLALISTIIATSSIIQMHALRATTSFNSDQGDALEKGVDANSGALKDIQHCFIDSNNQGELYECIGRLNMPAGVNYY